MKISNLNSNYIFLDGFPRNKENYEVYLRLKKVWNELSDIKIKSTIFLNCSDEELRRRLKIRNRDDDTGIIDKRIDTYHNDTVPVMDILKRQVNFICLK